MKKILQRFKNEMQQRIKKKGKKYTQGWTDALAVLEMLMVGVTPATEILARVMWGGRPNLCGIHEMDAARAVGYTFLNRLNKTWWGNTYAEIAKDFYGYKPTGTTPPRYYTLAKELITKKETPLKSLFILSYGDLHKSNRIWLIEFAEWEYQAIIRGTKYGLFGFLDDPAKIRGINGC